MKRKRLVTAGAVAVLIIAASSLPMEGQAAAEGVFVQPAPMMTAVQSAEVNGQALSEAAKTGVGTGPIQEEPGGGSVQAPLRDTSFQQEHPAKVYYRDKVIALMYHEVTPGQKNKQSLNAAKFERQLILMKESGFQWITMKQYAEFVLHGKSVPPNAVLMTFDDGYESFYEYVYPLLLKYRVPATSFLIVGTIDHPQHAGIPKLNWKQVREMHASGVDFYSHSFDSHQYAPLDAAGKRSKAILRGPVYSKQLGRKETQEEYAARVRRDLEKANAVLREKIGNDMNVIAFPYGVFSPSLLRICKDLDMRVSFTVLSGINRPGGLNGYRVNAGGADNDPERLIEVMKRGAVPGGKTTAGGKAGAGRPAASQQKPPNPQGVHLRIAED